MWPIKEKENRQLLIKWPNLVPYSYLKERVVSVLLLKSTPLIELPQNGFYFPLDFSWFKIQSLTYAFLNPRFLPIFQRSTKAEKKNAFSAEVLYYFYLLRKQLYEVLLGIPKKRKRTFLAVKIGLKVPTEILFAFLLGLIYFLLLPFGHFYLSLHVLLLLLTAVLLCTTITNLPIFKGSLAFWHGVFQDLGIVAASSCGMQCWK